MVTIGPGSLCRPVGTRRKGLHGCGLHAVPSVPCGSGARGCQVGPAGPSVRLRRGLRTSPREPSPWAGEAPVSPDPRLRGIGPTAVVRQPAPAGSVGPIGLRHAARTAAPCPTAGTQRCRPGAATLDMPRSNVVPTTCVSLLPAHPSVECRRTDDPMGPEPTETRQSGGLARISRAKGVLLGVAFAVAGGLLAAAGPGRR